MPSSKKFQKHIFSYAGLALLLCAIIAFNAIISRSSVRADLTEEKLYTLSDGTKAIISKLDAPVTLRFYRSRSENRMPVQLASFADRIRSLLGEYAKHGNGRILLDELDPTPDSDAEDAAAMDNVSGQPMPDGEKLYLGLAVNFLDKTVSIPFFFPHEEATVEYNITSAISEAVAGDAKNKIGILTELPLLGGNPMPYMRKNNQNAPWIIAGELQKRFELVPISPGADQIPADIKALVVIHPKNLSEKTLFAVDQYLMRGGKLLIALDSYCLAESRNSMQAMMGQPAPPGSSNIPKFLHNWKLEFSDTKVVADVSNAMRNINNPEMDIFPTVLDIRDFAEASSDPAISNIKHLNMVYCGAFSGSPADGLKIEKIVVASDNSALVDSFMSEMGGAQVMRDFKKDMKEKTLIAKLSGKFKTAFPDGPPEEKNESGDKAPEPAPPAKKPVTIKESPETVVVLLSDADMFADEFCVQKQNFLGSTIIQPFNDNLLFLQNIIEQLSGAPELLAIRSRKIRQRPFTKIVEKLNEAQDKYQQEIQRLEKSREDVEARINEIQRGKTGSQQFILTREQKEQIEKYRKEAAETAKKLKQTKKELRKDIDKMQMHIQIINTAAVPVALIAIGIGIWLNGRRRRSK